VAYCPHGGSRWLQPAYLRATVHSRDGADAARMAHRDASRSGTGPAVEYTNDRRGSCNSGRVRHRRNIPQSVPNAAWDESVRSATGKSRLGLIKLWETYSQPERTLAWPRLAAEKSRLLPFVFWLKSKRSAGFPVTG
jgi:hypothetical protein